MTRGRDANIAYVAVDKLDATHEVPHPGDNDEVTGRSVLYGVLHHVGAELSAHETIVSEPEGGFKRWKQQGLFRTSRLAR